MDYKRGRRLLKSEMSLEQTRLEYVKKIKAELKSLEHLAMKAYQDRNFALEDKYDEQIAKLKKQLVQEVPFTPAPLKEGECQEHHWDKEAIARYGDDRCAYCMMKSSYYNSILANLNTWSEEDRKTSEYQQLVYNSKCRPHKHHQPNSLSDSKTKCI